MNTHPSFSPDQHVTLQLSEYRAPGPLESESHAFTFTVIRAYEPFSKAVVLLARCDALSSSPVIVKIHDPRFLDDRFKRLGNGGYDRPWTLKAEAVAVACPEPLHWDEVMYSAIPSELKEDEPTSSADVEYRAVRWELYYQHTSRESFESELGSYQCLHELQGTVVPRLLGVGYHVPSDQRCVSPSALVMEYIDGVTVNDAPAAALTPSIVARLYQDIQLLGPRGVMHNDLNRYVHPTIDVLASIRAHSYSDNILLTPANAPERAVIIDFGEAAVRKNESQEEWENDLLWSDERTVVPVLLMQKRIPWQSEFDTPSYQLPRA